MTITKAHQPIYDPTVLRRYNDVPPVNHLPSELLSRIFSYQLQRSPGGPYSSTEFAFSRVCHWWRQVALENPLLWAAPSFLQCPPWATEMVRRSKGAPLKIFDRLTPLPRQMDNTTSSICQWDEELVLSAVTSAARHICRISQLRLMGPVQSIQRIIHSIPLRPAPLLNDLALCADVAGDAMYDRLPPGFTIPTTSFDGAFPRLRTLKLNNCCEIWNSPILANTITRLAIGVVPKEERKLLEWSTVLDVLTNMPALYELELTYALPLSKSRSLDQPVHQLPKLRSLTLFDTMLCCGTFLSYIDPHPNVRLLITAKDYTDFSAPSDDIYRKAEVMFNSFASFLLRTGMAKYLRALEILPRIGEDDSWDLFTVVGSRGPPQSMEHRLFDITITHGQDITDSWWAFATTIALGWMQNVSALSFEGDALYVPSRDWLRFFGSLRAVREVRCSGPMLEGFLDALAESRSRAQGTGVAPDFFPKANALGLRGADFSARHDGQCHSPGTALISAMYGALNCHAAFTKIILEKCFNMEGFDMLTLRALVKEVWWDGYSGKNDSYAH